MKTDESDQEEKLDSYIKVQSLQLPWLDILLPKEVINFLWDAINHVDSHTDAEKELAGNVSKSSFILDKDNWFYKTILEKLVSTLLYRSWDNYYCVHIEKMIPAPIFQLDEMWVNYQKQNEFNPPHFHDGHYSFVVFMKIPTHWKEQHALPFVVNSNAPCASDFQFLQAGSGHEGPLVRTNNIPLSPEDEGRLLFFPAWLSHQVFPFYGTEEERITIGGNIDLEGEKEFYAQSNESLNKIHKHRQPIRKLSEEEKEAEKNS